MNKIDNLSHNHDLDSLLLLSLSNDDDNITVLNKVVVLQLITNNKIFTDKQKNN